MEEEVQSIELLQSVEVTFVKTSPKLIERIAVKRRMTEPMVKSMMRYNVFTMNQFCQLTGLSKSTVSGKTMPRIVNGKLVFEIDSVFPFKDAEFEGPKFILRNEKSEKYFLQ